uniref:Uncharacterized protein n=1 Tax=Caenorhabditis tropicalis TaxID=1561998 RepID=A0A1I7UBE1_9PELO
MLPHSLFFSILFSFSIAHQIIHLNELKGNGFKNVIDVAPPFAVYFSGASDSEEDLKEIHLVTRDKKKSFYELKNEKPEEFSSRLSPFHVSSTAEITTSLEEFTELKGFAYIVSFDEIAEKCFRVYDVDRFEVVKTHKDVNCTLVFLNSNFHLRYPPSTKISNWHQNELAVANLYRGVPSQEKTPVFSNPLEINGKSVLFIPETFSLRFEAFYIRTSNHVYLEVQPGHKSLHKHTTSGYTTTGFYMRKIGDPHERIEMICVRDTRFNGTVGAVVSGHMPSNKGSIGLITDDEAVFITPKKEKKVWTTELADHLTISAKDTEEGEFFVQWFIVQDLQIAGTQKPMKGAGKGASGLNVIVQVLTIIFFSYFN